MAEREDALSTANVEAQARIEELESTLEDLEEKFRSQIKHAACSFFSQMEENEAIHQHSVSDTIEKAGQRLIMCWNRWKHEYILQLRSAHLSLESPSKGLNTGNVVIVEDAMKPKLFWRLVLVIETLPWRDGHVRACVGRTAADLNFPEATKQEIVQA